MKKIISIILLCALLVICLSGCNSNNNGDNTEQSSTTAATSRFKPNLKVNPPASDTPTEPQVLDNESELIKTLIKYLQQLSVEYDMLPDYLCDKINDIKGGAEPLYVGFDPSSYYYVCAYYNSEHDYEDFQYCCGAEYTWVRFEKGSEISEYYNDEKFLAGFQLNRSLGVTNILSVEADVPNMEHFKMYKPEFKEGLNVNAPIALDEEFYIFINRMGKDNVYHSESWYNHDHLTIPCVTIGGEYYIKVHLPRDKEGKLKKEYISYDFGKYYDGLMSIVHTEKSIDYGVISIDDFVNEIIKK